LGFVDGQQFFGGIPCFVEQGKDVGDSGVSKLPLRKRSPEQAAACTRAALSAFMAEREGNPTGSSGGFSALASPLAVCSTQLCAN